MKWKKIWKWILPICAFIIGYFLAPPDPFSQYIYGFICLLIYLFLFLIFKKYIVQKSKHKIFEIIRDVIFIAASIFGIIAFVRTCAHDNELEDLNYKLTSIDHQPILKLVGSPHISDIKIDTLSVKFSEHTDKDSSETDGHYYIYYSLTLKIRSKIKITNTSEKSIGKIIALFSTDKIPNVKDFIMGKLDPNNLISDIRKWPDLVNSHILPGETIELSTMTEIHYISDSKYVMHFIIFYKNDIGNLYHTHTKVPFEFEPLTFVTQIEMNAEEIEVEAQKLIKNLIETNKLMNPLNPVSLYEMYDRKEAKIAMENLEIMKSKFSLDFGKLGGN